MLWLHIRSASNGYHNIGFHGEIRKNINAFLFCWFKKGSCQFLEKEYAQVLFNCLVLPAQENMWLGKLTALNMTLMG